MLKFTFYFHADFVYSNIKDRLTTYDRFDIKKLKRKENQNSNKKIVIFLLLMTSSFEQNNLVVLLA